LKKILTSPKHPSYRQVLQVVGLSPMPLSRAEIFVEWHKTHSPKIRKNYIYDVVKDLYADRFLNMRYKTDRKISDLQLNAVRGEIILTSATGGYWSKDERRSAVDSKDDEKDWKYELGLK
jgi:hypothetical protein